MPMKSTPNPKTRRGSCLCGQSQFVLTGEPMTVAVCHCLNCKKSSGSAFMTNAFFKKDQVNILTPAALTTFSDSDTMSGNILRRTFCSSCGSLFPFTNSSRDDLVVVPIASVEGTGDWKPRREFFCADKWAWVPELEGTKKRAKL